ncbi:MAG: class I SAM-dependent methyltransferase [Bradyrhizobiaceae bacterium]|nr:class I SAM-dependent methyltransferase [Bradyrhizobiaceae bacterium]
MFTDLTRISRVALIPAALFALSNVALAQDSVSGREPVKLDVPFVPTPESVVQRMLELGNVKSGDYVIDLGSGDGRIAIAAAKRGARALGVDIDPRRIEEANANAAKAGVTDRVTFRRENLFETPIKDANVITMYLLTSVNHQLRPRLLEELRPGTRIVSHAFSMGEWEPDVHEKVDNRDVYLWIIPAKVGGRWTLKDGEQAIALDVEQEFQAIEGKATVNGRTVPITNGKLNGDEIVFTLEIAGKPETYQGKVSGGKIEAVAGPVATKRGWSATKG